MMSQMKWIAAPAAAVLSFAGMAAAQQAPGSVVFIERQEVNATLVDQMISFYNAGNGTTSMLFDMPDSVGANPLGGPSDATSSLSDIIEHNGRWYVSDGPFPPESPLTGKIWQIDNLFGAASLSELSGPSTGGNVLSRPLGLAWDTARNRLLAVNNPGSDAFPPSPRFEGILGIDPTTGAQTVVFDEDPLPGRPRYQSPGRIVADPQGNQDRFFVASVNGGTLDGSVETSTIQRMDYSGGSFTATTILDFGNTAQTGLAEPIGGVATITAAPGGDRLWLGSAAEQAIFEVILDGAGDVVSVSTLVSGISPNSDIEYDQFNNALVFGEGGTRLVRYNLDTGILDTLATDVFVRGVWVVPAPSGLALLGLGGLVATRRRRR